MSQETEEAPCPLCDRLIKKSSRFCKYCGTPLILCPHCKKLNERSAQFCRECGKKLEKLEEEKEPPIASRERPSVEIAEQSKGSILVGPPVYPMYYPQPYKRYSIFRKDTQETYSPEKAIHPYKKIKIQGYLSGPIPTGNVFSFSLEALGYSLLYIAIGVVISSIGLAFFGTIVLPIIGGLIGATFAISAPFFGIYLVSSTWLYKAFEIKRPVQINTIIWNYLLSNLVLSLLALFLIPIYLQVSVFTYALSVIGFIIYTMLFVVIPLKAFLADLLYVKAAVDEKEKTKQAKDIEQQVEEKEEKGEGEGNP
ncbi:MAG: zinc ribbon domain-containing protein [Candidatus Heimdallarchaeaceae archaeon]